MSLQKDEMVINQRMLKAKSPQQKNHLQELLKKSRIEQQQAEKMASGEKVISEEIPG